MILRLHIISLLWVVLLSGTLLNPKTAVAQQSVERTIKQNCLDCHNDSDNASGLNLSGLALSLESKKDRSLWVKIHDRVAAGEMPPDSPLPPKIKTAFTSSLGQSLVSAIRASQTNGRTVLRRLNRREFENSLHELLGVKTAIQHLLPGDGRAHGFDTVADGLRMSAVQLEKYLEVIDLALDDAIRLTERPRLFKKRMRYHDEEEVRENLTTAEDYVNPSSGERHRRLFKELRNAIVFISHGYSPDHLRQFAPPAAGLYRIRASAYAVDSRDEPIALKVYSSDWKNNRLLGYFDLREDEPRTIELSVRLTTREHLRFSADGIGVDDRGRNVWTVDSVKGWKVPGMAIEWVEVEGPLLEEWPPAGVTKLFGNDSLHKLKDKGQWTDQGHIAYELAPESPKEAAATIIKEFAAQAFRRPLVAGGADQFITLANKELDRGRTFEQAMRVAIRAILLSPRFLILDEAPGPLDEFAVASRLSYLFWSSPPDEELLRLAAAKSLLRPQILHQQVERLLADEKSQQFVASFVGQWLDINNIDATIPDKKLYPEYDELLRGSMVRESEEFFREVLVHNLPVSSFISSDFVTIDRRLADHYEFGDEFHETDSQTFGEQFRRVPLPADSVRGGVMTQAAVLKVTANGTVTSPVVRGSWVLRQIIGKPPSPPPPVDSIEPDTRGATTIREQLAKHRHSETCNRCHRDIDPPGFALESFDVVGGFRERYRSAGAGDPPKKKLHGRNIWEYKLGQPVDCSGQTSDGQAFADVREFKQLMLGQQSQIIRCITGKLLTYATGSGISFADRSEVDRIADKILQADSGLRTLIHEVVASQLFLNK